MNAVYQTKAVATGGRNGKVSTDDGLLNFEVRIPNSMGGPGGEYTNPEQLFAAGYAACFDSALNFVARSQKLRVESKTSVSVGLQSSDSGFNLIVEIDVEINGVERSVAQELLDKAHLTCPYSKAIHGNVDVTVRLAN